MIYIKLHKWQMVPKFIEKKNWYFNVSLTYYNSGRILAFFIVFYLQQNKKDSIYEFIKDIESNIVKCIEPKLIFEISVSNR